MSKPLPMLPEQSSLTLMPPPLRLRDPAPALAIPRSHFSTSTISTTLSSPSSGNFDFNFSDTHSLADSAEIDLDADLTADIGSGDESAYSPIKEQRTVESRFTGYSLPETSEMALQKPTPLSSLSQVASRTTFGGTAAFGQGVDVEPKEMSALEELLSEMGYLGEAITGK